LSTLVALPLFSCGLIDPNVTEFALNLPEKDFRVDTADWQLTVSGEMPSIPCPPAGCAAAVDQICAAGACTATCDAQMACAAGVRVSVFQMFDLVTEASWVKQVEGQPLIEVEVRSIAFRIDENTLNVASPPLTIYLAPQAVTDPLGGSAVAVGTLASVEPGFTGEVALSLTDAGKMAMAEFLGDYMTPFNVIVAGDVTVSAGQPVPTGKMSGVVKVAANTSL
jgi:hypothetical protein